MKITIEIPDPKFQVGDVIRYTNNGEVSGFLMIGKIHAIVGRGDWDFIAPHRPIVNLDDYRYLLACQDGCLTTAGTPIRPGTYQSMSVQLLDEIGEKVDYQGTDWTPDTPENLMERWNKWKVNNN